MSDDLTTLAFANSTDSSDDDTARLIGWILIPTLLGCFLYTCVALMVWPYARPVLPFWILFVSILFPPFLPFLLFYLLFLFLFTTPSTVVEQPSVIYVVERGTRVRPALPSRAASTRV